MNNDRYEIDAVEYNEATYRREGGLNAGIPRAIRVYDKEQGLIVISLEERSRLHNKEKCFEVLGRQSRIAQLEEELKKYKQEDSSKPPHERFWCRGCTLPNDNKQLEQALDEIAKDSCLPCGRGCSYPKCTDDLSEYGKRCPIGIAKTARQGKEG